MPALHRLAPLHLNTRRLHRRVQQSLQIGTVDGGVRRAIQRLRPSSQTQSPQHLAAVGITGLQALGKSRHLRQCAAQTPSMQHTRHIGPHLDARPHLAQLGRTLEQLHRQALARTGQSGGQTADTAPCDQDLLGTEIFHPLIVPRQTKPSPAGARCFTVRSVGKTGH